MLSSSECWNLGLAEVGVRFQALANKEELVTSIIIRLSWHMPHGSAAIVGALPSRGLGRSRVGRMASLVIVVDVAVIWRTYAPKTLVSVINKWVLAEVPYVYSYFNVADVTALSTVASARYIAL